MGIYRGHSLRNLYTNDLFTPLSIDTTPLNYRGEVVFSTILVFILHLFLVNLHSTSPVARSLNLVFVSGSLQFSCLL